MFSSSREQRPLFWLGGHPISTVSFLMSLYVAGTIATALLMALGRNDLVQLFVYNSKAVAHGEIWRLATYSFVNTPSIWFALEIGMLFFFGRLVETGIGSKAFSLFYGGLLVLQGILFQGADLLGYPTEAHGMEMISMGLFTAVVAMIPSASFFFGIAARWMLLLLLGLSSLQLLAEHQWLSIGELLTLCIATVFFMKKNGFREPLYFFSPSSNKLASLVKQSLSKPVVLPAPTKMEKGDCHFTGSTLVASIPSENLTKSPNARTRAMKEDSPKNSSMMNIDQLLDKINSSGLNSLTDQEKEELEAARLALLARDRRN